mgnify:CR=1 FL=1
MKNFKYGFIVLGLASAMLTSCGDSFLDTTPKTSLNTSVYYKTPDQAESALVGCYGEYQRTISNGSYPTMYQASEMMSDECFGGGGSGDITNRLLDRFDKSMSNAQSDIFSGIWGDYYKCIYNCNMLISSLDNISWSDQADRTRIEGEVRALRGLAYFDLVRMFENVPLITTPTKEVVPQANPDDVYAQVVSDLEYAADNLPVNLYTDNDATLGRISKYAAEAMLGRVYLFYDGVYNSNEGKEMPGGLTKSKALDYVENVISSGKYSLESDFTHLWPGASTQRSSKEEGKKSQYNEASKEILWVVKFNNDKNWTNGKHGYNSFVINIGMPSVACAPFGYGWGACPVTPEAKNWFDADDKRANASIIDSRTLYNDNSTTPIYDDQINTSCFDFTGYTIKKYAPLVFTDGTTIPAYETDVTGGNLMTSQDQDYILMRYADVLLMAAELGSTNAESYYNLVEQRAYGNTSHNLSSAPTREQIWQERSKEFIGEGLRYWDLRRQGLDAFVSALTKQASLNGTPIEVYSDRQKQTIASSFQEENIRSKRGFWQIPAGEIRLSGNVYKQNQGW